MKQPILIIEDDRDLANLIALHLQDLGFDVRQESDGLKGLQHALSENYALVILDIALPSLNGLEICRRLRAASHYVPILMLTARSSEIDRVVGLEIGADDYLTKPFSVPELLARVKAILRRVETFQSQAARPASVIRRGGLVIDADKHSVKRRGEPIHLTPKEFELLMLMASHPGRVYTRSDLLDLIWGDAYSGYEHTVNSHINRLRAKIERDPNHPDYILTVWGIGYQFVESAPE